MKNLKNLKHFWKKEKNNLKLRKLDYKKIREENEYKLRQQIFILKLVLPDDKYNEVIEIIRLKIKDECPEVLETFNNYVI